MSIEYLAICLHHSTSKGTDKLVLLGIANHAGDGGAWPTVSTLARYANVNARQVQKCLQRLVSRGEIAIYVQGGGTVDYADHERPNRYDVRVQCPPHCDRSANHRTSGAQLRLWGRKAVDKPVDNRVSSRTGGVLQDRGGGVLQDTQTITKNPEPTNVVASVTTGTRADHRPCTVCGHPQEPCRVRARNTGDDHRYTPVVPSG
jgi:hypothetical protein